MSAVDNKMAELAARFAARSAEERTALSTALHEGDLAALQSRAHKLAGIAPMFGHSDIGEAALELELAVEESGDVEASARRLDTLLAAIG